MPRDVQFRAMQGCMLSPTKTRLDYASAWRTEGRQENREGEASLDKAPKPLRCEPEQSDFQSSDAQEVLIR